jgi:hypothetical protein
MKKWSISSSLATQLLFARCRTTYLLSFPPLRLHRLDRQLQITQMLQRRTLDPTFGSIRLARWSRVSSHIHCLSRQFIEVVPAVLRCYSQQPHTSLSGFHPGEYQCMPPMGLRIKTIYPCVGTPLLNQFQKSPLAKFLHDQTYVRAFYHGSTWLTCGS